MFNSVGSDIFRTYGAGYFGRLGSCGTAPMMQIGFDYYENLSKESVDKILADCE